MKNFWKISFVLAFCLGASACVTQKKKGAEVSKFQKGYHNLTAKYNYWFNADELFRLTTEKLSDGNRDNYNQILEIYPYIAADPLSAKADLDNVITKSSKGIALHRPSEFVDDCYTLLGQAQFLKRDFETAEATFLYIKAEYNPNIKTKAQLKAEKRKKALDKKKAAKQRKKELAKKRKHNAAKKKKEKAAKKKQAAADRKKSKELPKDASKTITPPATPVTDKKQAEPPPNTINPYKKKLQRTAAFPLAMVWYGRVLVAREKYDEAEFLYRSLWEDPWFPASLHDDLYTAEADLWIKQKQYDKAIEPLNEAILLTKNKKTRARLAYILAQLAERTGRFEAAEKAYAIVLRNQPVYDMEFNARLRQVQAAWTNQKITSAQAIKDLEKMASDFKNQDYRDQIYFVMANIALKDGQKKDGIVYLRRSLDFNKNNAVQRAESYLKLADLYYEDENFVKAKVYYDSTVNVLPATDPRYKRASDYAVNLKDIARLIGIIAANDSIVRIYNMDDSQRKDFAKVLKKQREEESAAAEKAQAAAALALSAQSKAPTPQAGARASSFYFYNDAFLKKGRKDFNRTWGDRKLEDNWRRSRRIIPTSAADEQIAGDSTKANGVSSSEITDLFKGIPANPADLAVLQMATYEAMYQLGTLFRDKLANNQKCTGTLEEMQTRYSDTTRFTKYEKETWYYCYLAFTDLSNAARAKYYYDKLVGKYPNSAYARVLSDPNFVNANAEKKRELERYYEETFKIFQAANYKEAYDRCQEAPKKYGSQNPMMAKFALLGALCTGNLQGNEAYCKALSEVIARYPASAEATRAKEISRLMSCKGFEVADIKNKPGSDEKIDEDFTLEDDKLHYFMIAITGDVKLDDVKIAVTDYNRENHKLDQLRISNIFLGTDTNTPIIVVRKFDNKQLAMKYYKEVKDLKDFLGENGKKIYQKEFFAVTQENYRRILKNKTLSGYREFFANNYLK
jgi:tetratricopeptide (TPR) repeat protein